MTANREGLDVKNMTVSSFFNRSILLALTVVLLSACASILPTETTKHQSPWGTFEDTKNAYNSIEINKTDLASLEKVGFNPQLTSNITILGYLDVVNRFSPLLQREDLPKGINDCIAAKERCIAYVANPSNTHNKRIGSVMLDLLTFRQETRVTGWEFEAMFVIVDDIVVYKLWNGTPDIEQYRKRVQPLGPLQSIGSSIRP